MFGSFYSVLFCFSLLGSLLQRISVRNLPENRDLLTKCANRLHKLPNISRNLQFIPLKFFLLCQKRYKVLCLDLQDSHKSIFPKTISCGQYSLSNENRDSSHHLTKSFCFGSYNESCLSNSIDFVSLIVSKGRRWSVYYELYIDVFFLENFAMDFILLAIVRKMTGCLSAYWRICLGALAGAFLTCLAVALPVPYAFVKLILLHGLANIVMVKIGIQPQGDRKSVV